MHKRRDVWVWVNLRSYSKSNPKKGRELLRRLKSRPVDTDSRTALDRFIRTCLELCLSDPRRAMKLFKKMRRTTIEILADEEIGFVGRRWFFLKVLAASGNRSAVESLREHAIHIAEFLHSMRKRNPEFYWECVSESSAWPVVRHANRYLDYSRHDKALTGQLGCRAEFLHGDQTKGFGAFAHSLFDFVSEMRESAQAGLPLRVEEDLPTRKKVFGAVYTLDYPARVFYKRASGLAAFGKNTCDDWATLAADMYLARNPNPLRDGFLSKILRAKSKLDRGASVSYFRSRLKDAFRSMAGRRAGIDAYSLLHVNRVSRVGDGTEGQHESEEARDTHRTAQRRNGSVAPARHASIHPSARR